MLNDHTLQKNVLLKLNFQGEGHLDACFFIYILTIYRKCVLFRLLSRGIRAHISILTVIQKRHITVEKWSYFTKKCTFEGLEISTLAV